MQNNMYIYPNNKLFGSKEEKGKIRKRKTIEQKDSK